MNGINLRISMNEVDDKNERIVKDKPKVNTKNKVPLIKKPILQNINSHGMLIPWTEKYRPISVDDLVTDANTLTKIKKIIDDRDMPNIIITGIPGIGKTTTILCIAHNILGKYFDQAVLELNASDDRGIKAVQDSIIYFCKKKLDLESPENKDKIYAKHKIVLLDEADNMTDKAQRLINNLMQTYHNTTRFAFTCNNSSDIIEAIQSRCIIFRYKRLSNEQITSRLKYICGIENVTFTEEGINAIVTISQGDMRQAINILHLTYNGCEIINENNVYKLCDKPSPIVIKNIYLACYEKDIRKALLILKQLRDGGYSNSDISISMINTIKSSKITEINEATKIKFLREICNTCLNISKGIDTPLQLTGCIAAMCK